MVLLAAPPHEDKLRAVASRAIRRDSALTGSRDMGSLRAGFRRLASRREATREQTPSLYEQLSRAASRSSTDGSSTAVTEEDLRQTLQAAIGSFAAMNSIYQEREQRWAQEMARAEEDKLRVQNLFRQVLGSFITDTPAEKQER